MRLLLLLPLVIASVLVPFSELGGEKISENCYEYEIPFSFDVYSQKCVPVIFSDVNLTVYVMGKEFHGKKIYLPDEGVAEVYFCGSPEKVFLGCLKLPKIVAKKEISFENGLAQVRILVRNLGTEKAEVFVFDSPRYILSKPKEFRAVLLPGESKVFSYSAPSIVGKFTEPPALIRYSDALGSWTLKTNPVLVSSKPSRNFVLLLQENRVVGINLGPSIQSLPTGEIVEFSNLKDAKTTISKVDTRVLTLLGFEHERHEVLPVWLVKVGCLLVTAFVGLAVLRKT